MQAWRLEDVGRAQEGRSVPGHHGDGAWAGKNEDEATAASRAGYQLTHRKCPVHCVVVWCDGWLCGNGRRALRIRDDPCLAFLPHVEEEE